MLLIGCLLATAADALQFSDAYGRPALSLSAMRRDRNTPNGLTDFLVVQAIQALGRTGIEEVSLNLAAFARWLHSPHPLPLGQSRP